MEFPRHVHKAGGLSKIVTEDEWPAAEAEGWLIDPNTAPAPDADLASALTDDLERQDAEKVPPDEAGQPELAPDAPGGDEPVEEPDAEPSGRHRGGKKK